jgi:hypothetical protein
MALPSKRSDYKTKRRWIKSKEQTAVHVSVYVSNFLAFASGTRIFHNFKKKKKKKKEEGEYK